MTAGRWRRWCRSGKRLVVDYRLLCLSWPELLWHEKRDVPNLNIEMILPPMKNFICTDCTCVCQNFPLSATYGFMFEDNCIYEIVHSSRTCTHAHNPHGEAPFVAVTNSRAWCAAVVPWQPSLYDGCCCWTWKTAAARDIKNWNDLPQILPLIPRAMPDMFKNLLRWATYGYRGLRTIISRCSLLAHTHAYSQVHTQKHRSWLS